MDIQELKKDLEEIKSLSVGATRQRVKDILSIGQHKIETDIINLEIKQRAQASSSAPTVTSPTVGAKRYKTELQQYAWDQSDKFAKIFVTLKDVHNLLETDVNTEFTNNSMSLKIQNLNNKDYSLFIKNLHSTINIEKSYHKIKTDTIVIYMKKEKEGENWSHLTLTEKRVKDMKDSAFKLDDNESKEDPTAGIMNLMKKMYQTGDSETKKMIAKVWTEGQDKKKNENF